MVLDICNPFDCEILQTWLFVLEVLGYVYVPIPVRVNPLPEVWITDCLDAGVFGTVFGGFCSRLRLLSLNTGTV